MQSDTPVKSDPWRSDATGSLLILCFSLIFWSVPCYRQCNLCCPQQPGFPTVFPVCRHENPFLRRTGGSPLKDEGACRVCGSAAIARMLRQGRSELGRATLICGKATGAPSLCHWWLLLLAPPKPWGNCNAIVQAAGELGEESRGAWWSKLTGNGGGCVGPKNYLRNKPAHKNKWKQEICQLIKKAHTRKYWGWASEAAWQAESQCIVVLPSLMYKMFSVPKVGLSHRYAYLPGHC